MIFQKVFIFILFILLIIFLAVYYSGRLDLNRLSGYLDIPIEFDNVEKPIENYPEFCVIAPVFNPASYESRYRSYRLFEEHITQFGVQLVTVELAVGNQTFQVTQADNPNHIQLKTDDVMWYKENLINIGIRRSPKECEYIAWIDLEVEFVTRTWVNETINGLKEYKVMQLFDLVRILGPDLEIVEAHASYAYCRSQDQEKIFNSLKRKYAGLDIKEYCASGYAWAAKKETILAFGGLFDKGIVGDGDTIMAHAFKGLIHRENTVAKGDFYKEIQDWRAKVVKKTRSKLGYVKAPINHLWHGSRKHRGYKTRRVILKSDLFPYKPLEHLFYDSNGLLHFKPFVRDYYVKRISSFFDSRREDLLEKPE